jgi:hypothetical protein
MIGLLFDKTDRDGQPLTASSLKNDYWSIKQHLHVEYYHKTLRLFWLYIDCKSKLPLLSSDISHCSSVGYPGIAWARKNNKKKERERDWIALFYCIVFFFNIFLSCTA